jgi:hypothetical protein
MKQKLMAAAGIVLVALLPFGFTNAPREGKVHLKVTKEENGSMSVFQKSYQNMDELKTDDELKAFDVLIDDWVDNHSRQMMIKTDDDTNNAFEWHFDTDEDQTTIIEVNKMKLVECDDDTEVIVLKKNGKTTIEVDVDEGDEHGEKEYRISINGDGDYETIVIDEDDDLSSIEKEKIESIIEQITTDVETSRRNEVTHSADEKGRKVIITKKDGQIETDIDVDVEVDVENNTQNEDEYIFRNNTDDEDVATESSKQNLKIIVRDKKEIKNSADTDHEMQEVRTSLTLDKSKDQGNESISVNIEKEGEETYIDIDIERTGAAQITISEIDPRDPDLKNLPFPLKNNLEPIAIAFSPVPGHGKFHLKFELPQKGKVTLKLKDLLGNDIYRETMHDFSGHYENEFDLTGRNKGIYILQIAQGKKSLSRRILIE